jgi:hypothetical protein
MRGFISDISFDAPRLCCNPKKLRTGQIPRRQGCKFNALNSEELMSFPLIAKNSSHPTPCTWWSFTLIAIFEEK